MPGAEMATWTSFSATATHGDTYVNTYANQRAIAYGKAEKAGTLPEGSVLAKDSFELTDRGAHRRFASQERCIVIAARLSWFENSCLVLHLGDLLDREPISYLSQIGSGDLGFLRRRKRQPVV